MSSQFLSSQDRTEEKNSKLTVEGNKFPHLYIIFLGKSLDLNLQFLQILQKIPSFDKEVQGLKCRIGILEGVNAKQHIITRELYDQQTDLINHNMRNILFHNIPENPMENVRPRQNPDTTPITRRLIINKCLVEVM